MGLATRGSELVLRSTQPRCRAEIVEGALGREQTRSCSRPLTVPAKVLAEQELGPRLLEGVARLLVGGQRRSQQLLGRLALP